MTRFRAVAVSSEYPDGKKPFTPAEELARDAEEFAALEHDIFREEKRAAAELKMSGVEFIDATDANAGALMLSATAEDQNGLAAVNLAVINARGAGLTISPIQFSFENDTLCVITDDNFNAIYAVWAPFRQEFFTA